MVWDRTRVIGCAALALTAACEGELESPGQLVLVVDTDMAIPAQLDSLLLEIEAQGDTQYKHDFDLGPTRATLPATLTLVSRDIGDDPVSIRVAASKLGDDGIEWRLFREAVSRVPRDRIATLRMPLQWLCKGQAEVVSDGDDSPLRPDDVRSTCKSGETCRAGSCQTSEVELESLPDYRPEDLYGGGETPEAGSCFDTVGCMQDARPVAPDARCTFARPAADRFNVALRVVDDGICDADAEHCYVPLNADDPEGWSLEGERVKLPSAVCDKLREGAVNDVLVSETCKRKTEKVPVCGPWSDVPKGKAGEYRPRGGGA